MGVKDSNGTWGPGEGWDLRQRNRIISLALDDAVAAGEMPGSLRRICQVVSETMGVDRASIWILSADGEELRCLSLFEREKNRYSAGEVLQATRFPRYLAALREEIILGAKDAQADPRTRELAKDYLVPSGITSLLDVAVVVEGSLAGVISLGHTGTPRQWLPGQEALALIAASLVAQLFLDSRHREAKKEIKARNLELSTLLTLSQHLRSARSSADLLPIVLDKTCRMLQADGGMVIQKAPGEDYFTITEAAGQWTASRGKALPPDRGGYSTAYASGKPYTSLDYSAVSHAHPPGQGVQAGPAVFVPIQSGDTVQGVLALTRRNSHASPFSPGEVSLITAIGEMAGNALHRQQLHESAQQRMQQLQALREIDIAITGNQDLDSTLQVTLTQVKEMLQVDAAAILRLYPNKKLQYEAWLGFSRVNPGQIKLPLGTSKWKASVTKGRSFFIPDLAKAGPAREWHALMGREGFQAYGAAPLITRGRVQGLLEVFLRKVFHPGKEWRKYLETLAGQTAIAIDNDQLLVSLEQANVELTLAYDATIEGWAYALDLRDEETEGHSQRVMEMTFRLAMAMDIPDQELLHIRRGALLHDIGKMGIPDAILHKPGKLTDQEWKVMRQHPVYAWEMLNPIDYLRPALPIPYCHHEKWDGSGYPRGFQGEEIPLEARIFAVVDVYDALTSHRPYRAAWTREKALELILQEKGKHFDPRVVELFLEEIKKVTG